MILRVRRIVVVVGLVLLCHIDWRFLGLRGPPLLPYVRMSVGEFQTRREVIRQARG